MTGRRHIVVFPPRRDRAGLRTERLTCERLESRQVRTTFHVSVGGDDLANGSDAAPFRSIQRGLDAALEPGDTVLVHEGRYAERVAFRAGGSARGGPITLAAAPGERPVIDVGEMRGGSENVVTIRDLGHVVVRGLEIVGNETREGGAAVWVTGAGTGIEIRDNLIHDLRGVSSMGIGVFGARRVPIRNITVTGNTLRANEKAGLVFGGCGPGVGRTRLSAFTGNVIAGNDTLGTGHGQVWIQYASDNTVRDNDVESSADGRLLTVEPAARRNRLDDNRYRLGMRAAAPIFQWRGRSFASLAAFTAASGQDRRSTVSSAD